MKVQIFQVSKNFGKFRALDEISLSIPEGMFGLLGPNGAGKKPFFSWLRVSYTNPWGARHPE